MKTWYYYCSLFWTLAHVLGLEKKSSLDI
jgi:hypothetical protein